MKRILFAFILLFAFANIVELNGQNYPFGTLPSNAISSNAEQAYTTFTNLFFEDCGDKGRIRWGLEGNSWEMPTQSVSEGIAYGMLFAAYYNDQITFDKLWKYYKAFPDANGLMNWKTEGCNSTVEYNAATDAELDAAMALIIADKAWGNSGSVDYANDAAWLIGQIKTHEVESGTYVLKPGDVWGGSSITNISYFAPAYFKAFGTYTNDEVFWNAVADKCYEIIDANLTVNNAVGGLVSDWCTSTGTQASGKSLNYYYDACRTPWRIAIDYAWYGDERAKSYLDKTNDFILNYIGGISNVVDGYQQNGTATGSYHNSTYVATFACAGIGLSNQSNLDGYYTEMVSLGKYSYFDYLMDLFGRTTLTGKFYNPLQNTTDVPVTGVSVSPATLSIQVGSSGNLSASVLPSNASNKSLTWSSNSSNVTVTSSGIVSGNSAGTAVVTATTADGGFTDSSVITVTETSTNYTLGTSIVGSGSISLSPSGGSYAEGQIVNATAVASSGYVFINWSGDASGTASTVSITMNSNKSIIANFEADNSGGQPCSNPTTVALPISKDGAGEFCWVTADNLNMINSWNMDVLEINGVDFTNTWANSFPNKIDGKYYIYYKASFGWSHFEASGLKSAEGNYRDFSSQISLYPNPLHSGNLFIQISEDMIGAELTISDLQGKLIYQTKVSDQNILIAEHIFKTSGVYFVKVSNNKNTQLLKLMVE